MGPFLDVEMNFIVYRVVWSPHQTLSIFISDLQVNLANTWAPVGGTKYDCSSFKCESRKVLQLIFIWSKIWHEMVDGSN